jgi:hypothetical protein
MTENTTPTKPATPDEQVQAARRIADIDLGLAIEAIEGVGHLLFAAHQADDYLPQPALWALSETVETKAGEIRDAYRALVDVLHGDLATYAAWESRRERQIAINAERSREDR